MKLHIILRWGDPHSDKEKEKTSGVKPCGSVSIKYRLRCTAGRPVETMHYYSFVQHNFK